ncbi:hypothetical protein N7519_001102 [Penicillium mononematosum]|uniref:uncharacterized protein n=1 Tax=Penicillium mononematosum TaxID=268346 RepID=UPI0025485C7F|nr:uncharacterized protein N7519_001102 [Penicillium mononematosum]KAJ6191081.1 hypothetical protein N7519_001102 [Penicillium mononematosum]
MAFPDSLAKSTPQFSSDLVLEMVNRTAAGLMRFTLLTPSTLARRNICQSTRPTIAESPLQTARMLTRN